MRGITWSLVAGTPVLLICCLLRSQLQSVLPLNFSCALLQDRPVFKGRGIFCVPLSAVPSSEPAGSLIVE